MFQRHYEAYVASMYPAWSSAADNRTSVASPISTTVTLRATHHPEQVSPPRIVLQKDPDLFPLNPVKGAYISPHSPSRTPFDVYPPDNRVYPDATAAPMQHYQAAGQYVDQSVASPPWPSAQHYQPAGQFVEPSGPVIPRQQYVTSPTRQQEVSPQEEVRNYVNDEVAKRVANDYRRRNLFPSEPDRSIPKWQEQPGPAARWTDAGHRTGSQDNRYKTTLPYGEYVSGLQNGGYKTSYQDGQYKTSLDDKAYKTSHRDGEYKTIIPDGEYKTNLQDKGYRPMTISQNGEYKTISQDGGYKTISQDGEYKTKIRGEDYKTSLEAREYRTGQQDGGYSTGTQDEGERKTSLQLTDYIGRAADLLKYKTSENEVDQSRPLADNKLVDSVYYEPDQNTSGDLLNMSLSDDGLLNQDNDEDDDSQKEQIAKYNELSTGRGPVPTPAERGTGIGEVGFWDKKTTDGRIIAPGDEKLERVLDTIAVLNRGERGSRWGVEEGAMKGGDVRRKGETEVQALRGVVKQEVRQTGASGQSGEGHVEIHEEFTSEDNNQEVYLAQGQEQREYKAEEGQQGDYCVKQEAKELGDHFEWEQEQREQEQKQKEYNVQEQEEGEYGIKQEVQDQGNDFVQEQSEYNIHKLEEGHYVVTQAEHDQGGFDVDKQALDQDQQEYVVTEQEQEEYAVQQGEIDQVEYALQNQEQHEFVVQDHGENREDFVGQDNVEYVETHGDMEQHVSQSEKEYQGEYEGEYLAQQGEHVSQPENRYEGEYAAQEDQEKYIPHQGEYVDQVEYDQPSQGEFTAHQEEYLEHQKPYAGQPGEYLEPQGEYVEQQGEYVEQQEEYVKQQGEYNEQQGEYIEQQGEYVEQQGEYMEQQGEYVQQQGEYIEPQGEYVEHQGEYVEQQGEYVDQQGEYIEPQGEYVERQGEYVEQKGEYVDQQGEYVEQQGEYVEQQGEYVEQQGEYVEQQGEYVEQQGEYVEQQGEYVEQQGEYIEQQGEYVQQQGEYIQQQGQFTQQRGEYDEQHGDYVVQTPGEYQDGYEGLNQEENGSQMTYYQDGKYHEATVGYEDVGHAQSVSNEREDGRATAPPVRQYVGDTSQQGVMQEEYSLQAGVPAPERSIEPQPASKVRPSALAMLDSDTESSMQIENGGTISNEDSDFDFNSDKQ